MASWKKIITSGSVPLLSHISSSGNIVPITTDGGSLGDVTLGWSDLFLDSGAVVNFDSGDVTLTHSSNTLTLGGGSLDVDGGIAIDNITIDGTEIDLSSGDLTIDVAGDIELNADGGDITFLDNTADLLTVNATKISGSAASTGSFGQLELDGGTFTSASLAAAQAANAVTALNNATANELVTVGSTTTELDAEANLIFDGTDMTLKGNGAKIEFYDENGDEHISANNGGVLSINAGTEVDITATTIDMNGAVDISGNTTIGGNLTVNGTTTIISSSNLDVQDQFIMLNSGSSAGDGGIIVSNQNGNSGSAFFFDDSNDRWGFSTTGSVGNETTTITPAAYTSAVVTNDNVPEFRKNGNIQVDSSGDIWIYVE